MVSLGKLNVGMEMLTGTVSMNHHFVVQIDKSSYDLGTWQSASGLSVKWNKCEYRPGDQGNTLYVLPGQISYADIKLSRAACSDSETVQEWLAGAVVRCHPVDGLGGLHGRAVDAARVRAGRLGHRRLQRH
jgi:hypothetical protein